MPKPILVLNITIWRENWEFNNLAWEFTLIIVLKHFRKFSFPENLFFRSFIIDKKVKNDQFLNMLLIFAAFCKKPTD